MRRKPSHFRIITCGPPFFSFSEHTTHLDSPSASSTRKVKRFGKLVSVAVGGPLAGQRAKESGIAGHNASAADELCCGSV
tara:strand:+ start:6266 stop:6505 length:240 start_codon:yes stop_codon:yes gene_type:complete